MQFSGHRIFLRQSGIGDDLWLIHGFPTSSLDWDGIWGALDCRYRVSAIDMLGFGQSDKPLDFAYSIGASADQWQVLGSQTGVQEVSIVAHDYGDTVAQELLARQNEGRLPFRINSVVLLNGGLFPEATRPLKLQLLLKGPLGPLVAQLASYRRFASSMNHICTIAMPEADLKRHWQCLTDQRGRRVLPKIIQYIEERRVNRERWVGALRDAAIPVCHINGVDDPISGRLTVARWRELLPDAPVFELDGVGHYPQWEAPERVLEVLARFLPA